MFKFLTRQHFLVNLFVAIALFFGLIFLFLSLLNLITRHNEYEQVPRVIGIGYEEAVTILEDKGFKVEVQDSVWKPEMAPQIVISQSPDSGQVVKVHRIIFLTVNKSQPPLVEMPNLVGFSFRNAQIYMNQLGLKMGDTTRKLDIARDAVLEQLYNGSPIKPGTRIFEGSFISFVLGSGLGEEEIRVPDLYGLTYSEARIVLKKSGINLGAIIPDPDVTDTVNAFIFRQHPEALKLLGDGTKTTNRMRMGQTVDIWLSLLIKPREGLSPDTLEIPVDTLEIPEIENN